MVVVSGMPKQQGQKCCAHKDGAFYAMRPGRVNRLGRISSLLEYISIFAYDSTDKHQMKP